MSRTSASNRSREIAGSPMVRRPVRRYDAPCKWGEHMARATEVFTPNDVPTFTYVERAEQKFEQRLRDAFAIPKMIISISGPSKTGKTVLVNKVIETDNLIPVSGASIKSADDLWRKVLGWMEAPVSIKETSDVVGKVEVGAKGGGKIGIPLVAEGKAEAEGKVASELKRGSEKTYMHEGLPQVIKDIAGSSYTVFIDDFHYIPREAQVDIGRQIKEAAEAGVKICTASVPHRADDVVRSNTELRGRVTAIDTGRWTESELEQIGYKGFQALNMDVAPTIMNKLTAEAFGSPQLMQAICLNLCFENKVQDTLEKQRRIEMDFVTLQSVLERTSTSSDFSTMVTRLHAGPKLRGHERKEYKLKNGCLGDVYRCALLGIKADPPLLTLSYDEILTRVRELCDGESPSGSSLSATLGHMVTIAESVQEAHVMEWDEDTLHIVEPYFLFFLRNSRHLDALK